MWRGFKAFMRVLMIWCACWWAFVWVVGSYQSRRVLGVDDLIPTADSWLDAWAAASEKGR